MPVEQFFARQDSKPLLPDIRRWSIALKRAAERGHNAVCRLDRQRDGLAFEPARLFLLVGDSDGAEDAVDAPWDEALNRWLIGEGIRAVTKKNESERFGFSCHDRFAPIELRYRNGFFGSVLVHFLRKEGFEDAKSSHDALSVISV